MTPDDEYAATFAAITDGGPADYARAFPIYLATGLGGPLPIPVGHKTPPPKGWTGWDAKYPSYADCEEWATQHAPGRPDYRGTTQLGLRVAPTVIGIDVDGYDGKHGLETMAEAVRRFGPLPEGPYSTARDDGSRIRFFCVPDGTVLVSQIQFQLDDGRVLSDVEVIQRHHRYAMVWPSIHPKLDRPYWWYDTAGPDVPPDDLPELPPAWLDGLAGSGEATERANEEAVREFLAALPGGNACSTVRRALDRALTDLAEAGSRHDTTRDHVLRLLRLGEQGHPGVPSSLHSLRQAFVRARLSDESATAGAAWAEFDRLSHGQHGIGLIKGSPTSPLNRGCSCLPVSSPTIIDSGGEQGGTSPLATAAVQVSAEATSPPEDPFEIGVERERLRRAVKRFVDAEERPPTPPPASTKLADLLAEPDTDPVYRINELWPLGGKVTLTAPQKAGKTTTVGNIVKALVDGTPLFGALEGKRGFPGFPVLPLRETGTVFLADFELDRRMLRRWLRDHGLQRPDRLYVEFFRGRTWDIRDDKIRTQWAAHLRELDTEIIIVDPIGPVLFALGVAENSSTEVGQFLHALDALVKESGASELLIAHHTGHNGERGRGTTALRGWPDAEWRLMNEDAPAGREPAPDATRFFAAQGRDVALRDTQLIYDAATRHLALGMGNRATHATEKHLPTMMKIIEATPGINKTALEEALQGEAGLERNTARKVTDAARGAGVVHTHKGPKNATLYYAGPSSPECHQ